MGGGINVHIGFVVFRGKFGEFFHRAVVTRFSEFSDQELEVENMLVVETLLLLEPSDENSFFLHELWEAQARTGKLGKYKFSSQNFLLNSLSYANEKFCKYLQLPTNYNKKESLLKVALPTLCILFTVLFSF